MKDNHKRKWYQWISLCIIYIFALYLLPTLLLNFDIIIPDSVFLTISIILAILLIVYVYVLSRKYPVPNKELRRDKTFLFLFILFILSAALLRWFRLENLL